MWPINTIINCYIVWCLHFKYKFKLILNWSCDLDMLVLNNLARLAPLEDNIRLRLIPLCLEVGVGLNHFQEYQGASFF